MCALGEDGWSKKLVKLNGNRSSIGDTGIVSELSEDHHFSQTLSRPIDKDIWSLRKIGK